MAKDDNDTRRDNDRTEVVVFTLQKAVDGGLDMFFERGDTGSRTPFFSLEYKQGDSAANVLARLLHRLQQPDYRLRFVQIVLPTNLSLNNAMLIMESPTDKRR